MVINSQHFPALLEPKPPPGRSGGWAGLGKVLAIALLSPGSEPRLLAPEGTSGSTYLGKPWPEKICD